MTFTDTICIHLLLSVYKLTPTSQCILCSFMFALDVYKWALSISQGLMKHKPHIKAAVGCVRQDRSEHRIFTVIKVNSGQPLGITLLPRLAASSLFTALWTLAFGKQPENPVVFQREEKKTCKSKLACLEPTALLPLSSSLSTAGAPPLTSG